MSSLSRQALFEMVRIDPVLTAHFYVPVRTGLTETIRDYLGYRAEIGGPTVDCRVEFDAVTF